MLRTKTTYPEYHEEQPSLRRAHTATVDAGWPKYQDDMAFMASPKLVSLDMPPAPLPPTLDLEAPQSPPKLVRARTEPPSEPVWIRNSRLEVERGSEIFGSPAAAGMPVPSKAFPAPPSAVLPPAESRQEYEPTPDWWPPAPSHAQAGEGVGFGPPPGIPPPMGNLGAAYLMPPVAGLGEAPAPRDCRGFEPPLVPPVELREIQTNADWAYPIHQVTAPSEPHRAFETPPPLMPPGGEPGEMLTNPEWGLPVYQPLLPGQYIPPPPQLPPTLGWGIQDVSASPPSRPAAHMHHQDGAGAALFAGAGSAADLQDRPAPKCITCDDAGVNTITWTVDAMKFDSPDKTFVCPGVFEVLFPDQDKKQFLLSIKPTEVSQERRGGGFKKAKGRGKVHVKCLEDEKDLPSTYPQVALSVFLGRGSRMQKMHEKPILHRFSAKCIVELPAGKEDLDFKAAVEEPFKTVTITVRMAPCTRAGAV